MSDPALRQWNVDRNGKSCRVKNPAERICHKKTDSLANPHEEILVPGGLEKELRPTGCNIKESES